MNCIYKSHVLRSELLCQIYIYIYMEIKGVDCEIANSILFLFSISFFNDIILSTQNNVRFIKIV